MVPNSGERSLLTFYANLFCAVFTQVQFKGKTIKMILKVNTKLFGSHFTIERYKEDGTIEKKVSTDIHCYLVGETEAFHTSVAISDCDGLVSAMHAQYIIIPLQASTAGSLVLYK